MSWFNIIHVLNLNLYQMLIVKINLQIVICICIQINVKKNKIHNIMYKKLRKHGKIWSLLHFRH